MRNVLSFITLVPYRSICQKLVTSSRGLYLNSEKRKGKRFLILTSATKREVSRRSRATTTKKCTKSVVHVQRCCFANLSSCFAALVAIAAAVVNDLQVL